jgi:hypothetical protein
LKFLILLRKLFVFKYLYIGEIWIRAAAEPQQFPRDIPLASIPTLVVDIRGEDPEADEAGSSQYRKVVKGL